MAKEPNKKKSTEKLTAAQYFKLPFEVYYSEHIPVTMLEFKSDIPVKKFEDVKIVHREQGGSWGASFYCAQNSGHELLGSVATTQPYSAHRGVWHGVLCLRSV